MFWVFFPFKDSVNWYFIGACDEAWGSDIRFENLTLKKKKRKEKHCPLSLLLCPYYNTDNYIADLHVFFQSNRSK